MVGKRDVAQWEATAVMLIRSLQARRSDVDKICCRASSAIRTTGTGRDNNSRAPSIFALHNPRDQTTFDGASARPFSVLSTIKLIRDSQIPEWHRPGFLAQASVAEKEDWLRNLLTTTKSAAEKEPSSASNHPNVDSQAFLFVLRALAVSDIPDAAIRAERWVRQLEQLSSQLVVGHGADAHLLEPTPECYQRVIEAWGRASHEDPVLALTRAELWLNKHLHTSVPLHRRPNTACINAFLDLCTKGRGFKTRKGLVVEHAEKAQSLLMYMISDRMEKGPASRVAPNLDSFNFVIRGWTRCRHSMDIVERTEEVLRLLENYQQNVDSDVAPDAKSYVMLLDAICVKAKLKLAKCRDMDNPAWNGLDEKDTIETMISKMHEMAAQGHPEIAPTTYTYNILILCWVNLAAGHAEAPYEAERVLRAMNRMREKDRNDAVAPDFISYCNVMRAWANSTHPNRAQRAAWWLEKQWRDYEYQRNNEAIRPRNNSYNIAIRAWADAGEPNKAEKLLLELIRCTEYINEKDLLPNSESFLNVIRAWTKISSRGSKEALSHAVKWLDRLLEYESRDTGLVTPREVYSIILDGARRCSSASPEVLDIAVETFDKLRRSHHTLSCFEFSRLLQTGLLALSREENNAVRTAFVKELVKDCAEAGLVGSPFLQALANGPLFYDGWTLQECEELVAEVFPEWPLPPSWTRNIKQEALLPKRADLRRTNFREISRHGHGHGRSAG